MRKIFCNLCGKEIHDGSEHFIEYSGRVREYSPFVSDSGEPECRMSSREETFHLCGNCCERIDKVRTIRDELKKKTEENEALKKELSERMREIDELFEELKKYG